MNKFRSIVDPATLNAGDIVQFSTAASPFFRRNRTRGVEGAKATHTHGYVVEKPLFNSQAGDRTVFQVFEILPLEHAKRLDKRYITVNQDDAGNGFGLHKDRQWAIVLDPISIDANAVNLGRRDGLIQRVGNIADSVVESRLLQELQKIGGEDALKFGPGDGPGGYKRPSEETWGLFARGLGRRNFRDEEFIAEKRPYKKKAQFPVNVLDMDLTDAVRVLNLPEDIAAIFSKKQGRGNPAITSLRTLWEMADKSPEKMENYIPATKTLGVKVLLADTDLHIGIINGLATPRAGTNAVPIHDLKSAFDLVSREDGLKALEEYMYMGPKTRQYAMEDIPALYQSLSVEGSKEDKISDIANSVKTAWRTLVHDYAISKETGQIPEKYQRPNGEPLWKLVPKTP